MERAGVLSGKSGRLSVLFDFLRSRQKMEGWREREKDG